MYFDELDLNDNVLDALYDMHLKSVLLFRKTVFLKYSKAVMCWE